MKKKSLTLLCVLIICLSMVLPVYATDTTARFVDDADLLSPAEETELLNKLDEISIRQGMDIVIVTVPSLYGEDITAFADDFYDYNGYEPDGILLLIAVYDREWAISTTGYGIQVFTDAGQDYLVEQFIADLSDGWYSDAFHTFADECDEFITQAKEGRPYDVGSLPKAPFNAVQNLLISLGIGFVAALIVTGLMKSKLKSVRSQVAASQYVKQGSMRITESREMFLYRQLHRQKRETPKSGGSSTHRSSSGRSHGGSRGSF